MQQLNGVEKIYGEINRKKSSRARHDLIGTICNSEIMHLLGFDQMETAGMQEAWGEIEEYHGGNVDKRVHNDILELITSFGNCQEEKGFKAGFHIATRLFVEGMNGGAPL